MRKIKVMDNILAANDAWARENRIFLREKEVVMFNIIGSPGSGKTTLLERTIELLKDTFRIGVIEGDLETAKDAERIHKKGVAVIQINTGNACHLDAHMVHTALFDLCKRKRLDLIFVENIGNLVCPAEFDIGEAAKIAVLSIAEGGDKIEKYPLIFSLCAALVVSKCDLLPYMNFDLQSALRAYRKINKENTSFLLDGLSGKGFEGWIRFLKKSVKKKA